MLGAAEAFVKLGISFVPCGPDKRPKDNPGGYGKFSWEQYQQRVPTALEAQGMMNGATGIGIIGGAVSGNLETIDFEDYKSPVFDEWCALVVEYGLAEVLEKCYIERSVRGGHHVVFRCEAQVPETVKLCHRMGKDLDGSEKVMCVIETRGEKHYACVSPTPGYEKVQGSLAKLPILTAEQHDTFHAIARSMEAHVEVVKRVHDAKIGHGVGDDFNARARWEDILTDEGWTLGKNRNGVTETARPGKKLSEGLSAKFGLGGTDLIYIFTTSLGIEPGCYTKFGYWCYSRHYGDFKACVKDLVARGYKGDEKPHTNGKAPTRPVVDDNPDRAPQRWLKASQVRVRQVDWLWNLYIPVGEVTMIVGNPGDGKSTVAQAIVTAVTRGASLFGDAVQQGGAIFLSAEQSVDTVTVPRFISMGADLDLIDLPDEVDENDDPVPFVLDKSGMEELRERCLETRPKIVVIDTVTAYIEASRDFNSANQTREWMRRLAEIARITPCAVVLLGHLNKNSNAHPLMRILGSIDFVGASRSVLLVGKDPDDEETRGIAQIKSNVGPFGDPRGFTLSEGEFAWTDGSDLDATRMLQPAAIQAAQSTRDKCAAWINSLFKDTNVIDAPQEVGDKIGGFTKYMVTETKKRMGIASVKDGMADGGWTWVRGGDAWRGSND